MPQAELKDIEILSTTLFIQLNDVYQIDHRKGISPGFARLAEFRKRIANQLADLHVDNFKFCLCGDFLAPSALSKPFKGKQMIDILNKSGCDLVGFGNHEFDEMTEDELIARLQESSFPWVSCNVSSYPLEKMKDQLWRTLEGIPLGNKCLLFLIGLLTKKETKKKPYTLIGDPLEFAELAIATIKEQAETKGVEPVFACISHLSEKEDEELAKRCPDVILILGGHDHHINQVRRIPQRAMLVKSLSNARSFHLVWLFRLEASAVNAAIAEFGGDGAASAISKFLIREFGAKTLRLAMFPGKSLAELTRPEREAVRRLAMDGLKGQGGPLPTLLLRRNDNWFAMFSLGIDTGTDDFINYISEEPQVAGATAQWFKRAEPYFGTASIVTIPTDLILEDERIRQMSTNFGNFVADVLRGRFEPWSNPRFSESADIGLINGGTFRLSGNLPARQDLTERDLFEIFYFDADKVVGYMLYGRQIEWIFRRMLRRPMGDGNFLQVSGLRIVARNRRLEAIYVADATSGFEKKLDPDRRYSVVTVPYVRRNFRECFSGAGRGVQLSHNIRSVVKDALTQLGDDGFKQALTPETRYDFRK